MSDLIQTRLRTIAELSHQHQGRPIEELLNAVGQHFPDMTVDQIETALRQAGDIYTREAERLQAVKEARKRNDFLDDFLP